jgi:hypothetical protein
MFTPQGHIRDEVRIRNECLIYRRALDRVLDISIPSDCTIHFDLIILKHILPSH